MFIRYVFTLPRSFTVKFKVHKKKSNFYVNTAILCFVFCDTIYVGFVFLYLSVYLNFVLQILRMITTYPVNIQKFILEIFDTCKFEF
jgi:hypothetical protein